MCDPSCSSGSRSWEKASSYSRMVQRCFLLISMRSQNPLQSPIGVVSLSFTFTLTRDWLSFRLIASHQNTVQLLRLRTWLNKLKSRIFFTGFALMWGTFYRTCGCFGQDIHCHSWTMNSQDKKQLLSRALSKWQGRWSNSENGSVTYEIIPLVSTRRLLGDFYVVPAELVWVLHN